MHNKKIRTFFIANLLNIYAKNTGVNKSLVNLSTPD
jgi:hypothetical protein